VPVINTKNFGKVEVTENQRIHFKNGILGFEENKDYYLIIKEDSPFIWLQSAVNENLAFVLINPYIFMPEYKLKVSASDWDLIELDPEKEDHLVFAIVTIPGKPEEMSANLQGPVIINPKKKLGVQAISLDDQYHIKHPILPALKKILSANGDK
jgi:flagellar assembly factor FliW